MACVDTSALREHDGQRTPATVSDADGRTDRSLLARRHTLRAARVTAGLTQAQLASRAGVRRETVSRLERGENEPTYHTALAIAHALGYTDPRLLFHMDFAPATNAPPALGPADHDDQAEDCGFATTRFACGMCTTCAEHEDYLMDGASDR